MIAGTTLLKMLLNERGVPFQSQYFEFRTQFQLTGYGWTVGIPDPYPIYTCLLPPSFSEEGGVIVKI